MSSQDPYLREAFPLPPILAYKRQTNLGDLLIRAKVPPKERIHPKRRQNGMTKCKQNGLICPYIKQGKIVKGSNFEWHINSEVNCQSRNIVYCIQCNKEKCKQIYIGETHKRLFDRFSEHLGYVRTKKINKATGEHYNQPGHSASNMTVTILEKVKSTDWQYRKEREKYLIQKFNSFYSGVNLKPS